MILIFQVAIFVVWCYGAKFLPTVVVALFLFAVTLDSFCKEMATVRNETCTMVYPTMKAEESFNWGGWDDHYFGLLVAQHFTIMVLLLHFGEYFLIDFKTVERHKINQFIHT